MFLLKVYFTSLLFPLCACLACVCVCPSCMLDTCGGQKRAPIPLELELQAVVSCLVVARTQTQVL